MRKDIRNTMDPELDLYEHWTSTTQKMRKDLRNTLDPELDLYHTAFMSYH